VVLQPDVAFLRVIPIRDVKLVSCAVGAEEGLAELTQIDAVEVMTVQIHGKDATVTADFDMVPFADWLHGVCGWFGKVVNGARIVVAGSRGVVDGDLDSVVAYVAAAARRQRIRPCISRRFPIL
jgi:hypothetical protein